MWAARVKTVLAQGMAAIGDGAMQRWFTAAFRADTVHGGAARVAELRTKLEACDPAGYAASCEATGAIDFRESNKRIACPTLVIAGTLDEATPVSMSEDIARAIPKSTLRTIEAAHLSAVEQPAAFARLVRDHLEKL
jgi:3-oxoadipate enol-lactonase